MSDDRKRAEEPVVEKKENAPFDIDAIENDGRLDWVNDGRSEKIDSLAEEIASIQCKIVKRLWKGYPDFVKEHCSVGEIFNLKIPGVETHSKNYGRLEDNDVDMFKVMYITHIKKTTVALIIGYEGEEWEKMKWSRLKFVSGVIKSKEKAGDDFLEVVFKHLVKKKTEILGAYERKLDEIKSGHEDIYR